MGILLKFNRPYDRLCLINIYLSFVGRKKLEDGEMYRSIAGSIGALMVMISVFNSEVQAEQKSKRIKSSRAVAVDDTVREPIVPQRAPNKFDTIYAYYLPGVGYVLSGREHVGIKLFKSEITTQSAQAFTVPSTVDASTLTELGLAVLRAQAHAFRQKGPARRHEVTTERHEQMFTAMPTPSAVTTTLISIELMLDDLLNRVNSGVSSALFAMRSHVAASVADMNVVFKNRMDEAFDHLKESEQKMLTQAMVLATKAQDAVDKITRDGFESASDLVCQTTADFANYALGLPIKRFLPPDLLCAKEYLVRDSGPQQEQLLTFRGVHLMPNEEYPSAKITVATQVVTTTTGGGDSVLQMPMPGGLNGGPNDTSLRGDRIAQAEFIWPKSKVSRRWLLTLKPYLVRSLDARMTPTIKGPIRRDKTQTCYIHASGGSLGSREEYGTCTIIADDGWEVEDCYASPPTTANGDAGIRNQLRTGGACQWEMHAKSKGLYGAGAWYGFEGRARLKQIARVSGKIYEARTIINQNETSAVFAYPNEYVPQEYEILQADWKWQLHYTDNTGRGHTLTDAQPTEEHIGTGTLSSSVLTYTVRPY